MLIIEPYSVDTAVDILAINVPEDDAYPAWSAAVRYSGGEVVTTGSGESLQIWQARLGSVAPLDAGSGLPTLYNEAIDPTGANTVGRDNAGVLLPNATEYAHFGEIWWRDATDDGYLSNRFRMFDPNPARVTRSANPIEFDIRPQTPWSGIALFNINADVVSIELIDGPEAYSATRTLRYPEILSPSFQNEPQAAFVDIPPVDPASYPGAFLRVRLEATASRWIHVGCVIIGPAIRLGHALYGLETELMDFSRFTRDVFGNITTIQRGYSDKVTYPHVIPSEFIGQARQILVARRATLTAFIGHPDVALTITYGYFIDLDVPIEGHSQTSASVVVESVLYDTPDSGEPLPDRVVFIEPDGTACIESHLGQAIELCVINGQVTERATATILDTVVGPLDTVAWELVWLEGGSEIAPEITTLVTDCEQFLPLFTWPPVVPVIQAAGIALVHATITRDDETVVTLEPAVIRVGPCGDGCVCAEEPVVDSYGWYDPAYVEPDPENPPDPMLYAYSLSEITESVEFEATEIPADGLEISGCAGQTKYYWADAGCYNGYIAVAWGVSVSGDDAYALDTFIEHGSVETIAIPTDESELEIVGEGSLNRPTWGGILRLLLRVDFVSDCESALLDTGATCGLPMNVDGSPITAVTIEADSPTTILPIDVPEGEDPVYYVVEVDLESGDVLDQIDVVLDGDTTVYVGVDSVPTETEYDAVLTGTDTGSLSDLGIESDSSIVLLVVGEDGTQSTVTVSPTVIPAVTLSVQSATHGQITSSPVLEFVPPNVTLVVQSAMHGQTADAITLADVSTGVLEVQSARHSQTADAITLIQHHVLEVQSTRHAQTADNLWLGELSGNILRDSSDAILRDSAGNILRGADA